MQFGDYIMWNKFKLAAFSLALLSNSASAAMVCENATVRIPLYDGAEKIEQRKVCFSADSEKFISPSCYSRKKNCAAIEAALKGTALNTHGGEVGTPLSSACTEAGGQAQQITLEWRGHAYRTSRCLVGDSFIDLGTFFSISLDPMKYLVE